MGRTLQPLDANSLPGRKGSMWSLTSMGHGEQGAARVEPEDVEAGDIEYVFLEATKASNPAGRTSGMILELGRLEEEFQSTGARAGPGGSHRP